MQHSREQTVHRHRAMQMGQELDPVGAEVVVVDTEAEDEEIGAVLKDSIR